MHNLKESFSLTQENWFQLNDPNSSVIMSQLYGEYSKRWPSIHSPFFLYVD